MSGASGPREPGTTNSANSAPDVTAPSTQADPTAAASHADQPATQAGADKAQSTAVPSASASQRYHRFPERAPGQRATRARALNAFWTANAARQLMPANENGGSLNPSIREED